MANCRRRPSVPEDDGEAAFLSEYDPERYDRLSLAVDVILLSVVDGSLYTLLSERREHPHKGRWALPGGFVRPQEGLDAAAARVLREKGGLRGVFLEQLYTFGHPGRDPRTRVVSVAYFALVEQRRFAEASQADPRWRMGRIHVPWRGEVGGPADVLSPEDRPLDLAFDHAEMIGMCIKRLRGKIDYVPLGFELLGNAFTLLDLQRVHEAVLARRLNKDSFRRRMLKSGLLKSTGRSQTGVGHRPAELYQFVRTAPEEPI